MSDRFGKNTKFLRTLDFWCVKCKRSFHREYDGNMGVQRIAESLREEGFKVGMEFICPSCREKRVKSLPHYLKKN